MTAGERAAMSSLHAALTGVFAMGGLQTNQHGHVPGCCFGYWLRSAHPEGEPCSERCQAAQDAVTRASRLLEESEVRQGVLV